MAPLLFFFFSITSCFKVLWHGTARCICPINTALYFPSCRSGCWRHQIMPWPGCRWLCAEAETPGQKTTLPLSASMNPGRTTSCSQRHEPLLSPGEAWAALPAARNGSVAPSAVGEAPGNFGENNCEKHL